MTRRTSRFLAPLVVLAGTSLAVAAGSLESTASSPWHRAARAVVTDLAAAEPACGPWFVIGPFDDLRFDLPFAPEAEAGKPIDTNATYRGKRSAQLSWRPVEIPEGQNFDVRALCPNYEGDGTFYLTRTIASDKARTYAVSMRGMSGLAVWLGGKQLVDRGPGDGWLGGGWDPKEAVLLPLAAGENRLLVKVHGLRKYSAWHFLYGTPSPDAVRYTLSKALTRRHSEATSGLTRLRRDGLDLLKIWPAASRDPATSDRLLQATQAALARSDAWLKLLGVAKVPKDDLAASSAELEQVRAELARPHRGGSLDPQRLDQIYFRASAASRRLENLPQGLVISNWLQLDQLNPQSPMDAKVIERISEVLRRGRALAEDYRLWEGDSPIFPGGKLGQSPTYSYESV